MVGKIIGERLPLNYHNVNAISAFFCVGIESESDGESEEVAEASVKNLLLNQVANVIGLKIKPIEVAESKAVTTSKCGL